MWCGLHCKHLEAATSDGNPQTTDESTDMTNDNTTVDPVAEAARRIVRLFEAMDSNERINGRKKPYVERALWDTKCAEERYIMANRASSMSGVIAQLIMIAQELGGVGQLVKTKKEREFYTSENRILSMLYSILDVIERETGLNSDEFARSWYMLRENNPHEYVKIAFDEEAQKIRPFPTENTLTK